MLLARGFQEVMHLSVLSRKVGGGGGGGGKRLGKGRGFDNCLPLVGTVEHFSGHSYSILLTFIDLLDHLNRKCQLSPYASPMPGLPQKKTQKNPGGDSHMKGAGLLVGNF